MPSGSRESWTATLASVTPFQDLPRPSLELLAERATDRRLDPGEVLVRQGDPADALYVVLAGRLEVALRSESDHAVTLAEVGAGDVIGEIALLLGGRRSSTVRCVEPATVLAIPSDAIGRVLRDEPALLDAFGDQLRSRLRRLQLASYVSELFGPLRRDVLDEIEREVAWVSLPAGEVLFRQGDDAADGIYVLLGGRARVVVEQPGGGEVRVAEVGRGECVGEMALLGDGTRSATVHAVRDSELARLSREAFDRLMGRHPSAMIQIARLLVSRLQTTTSGGPKASNRSYGFAVVPMTHGAASRRFAAELCAALAEYDATLWLSSRRVDEELGRPGIAQSAERGPGAIRLTQWLLEQEASHPVVVYEADDTWSAWTRRCVRHADHLLMVREVSREPVSREVEQRVAAGEVPGRAARRSLVLVQPPEGTVYAATGERLAEHPVHDHFHVRSGVAEDFARLARLLTGRGVGLVLGGGGARGFAHIGVLRAMRDLGIPVDAIGGTSMGALIAGCHALGHPPEELTRLCREQTRRLLDPTLPMVSLLAGHRTGLAFRRVFGRQCIEDLPLPYFCISTNLTRAEEVCHRRGRLGRAIRASISLPGVLPPVTEESDLLIDGGLLNNLPVDVMRRVTGGGPVVAVDVSPDVDLRAAEDPGTELSGWRVLWSRLSPFRPRIATPGILSVLGRSVVVGSIVSQRQRLATGDAELYLPLPVGEWGLLEFGAVEEIERRGFEASIEPLRAWWKGDCAARDGSIA